MSKDGSVKTATIGDVLERYRHEELPRLSQTTQAHYLKSIELLTERFGKRRATDLTRNELEQFMLEGKARFQRNKQMQVLRQALGCAVKKWRWIDYNVCKEIERHPQPQRTRELTMTDVDAFRAHAPPALQVAMDLARLTGRQQRDLLQLKWNQVEKESLRFPRTGRLKESFVSLTPMLVNVLDRARQHARGSEFVVVKGTGVRGSRKGGPYTSDGFRAVWQRAMCKYETAGGEKFDFHDLRTLWLGSRAEFVPSDIQSVADANSEAELIELKEWLDLSDKIARANVARHVCALANSGGGYLVIGRANDGSIAAPRTSIKGDYSADTFSEIISKYLVPAVACEVFEARSNPEGAQLVVVRVPSCGSVPVCSKSSGPHDKTGKPQGIDEGVHYLRAPGPRSVPIRSPEQWRAVIRRCVVNEREMLLQEIQRLLNPASTEAENRDK